MKPSKPKPSGPDSGRKAPASSVPKDRQQQQGRSGAGSDSVLPHLKDWERSRADGGQSGSRDRPTIDR